MKRSLLTGVAYHGNRMPSHARADMAEIARAAERDRIWEENRKKYMK
ncbi:MAG: hypothetical protein IKM04_00450 [Clostridia bacterium]|nr:hypothetical protein [Clostridia bacterium]